MCVWLISRGLHGEAAQAPTRQHVQHQGGVGGRGQRLHRVLPPLVPDHHLRWAAHGSVSGGRGVQHRQGRWQAAAGGLSSPATATRAAAHLVPAWCGQHLALGGHGGASKAVGQQGGAGRAAGEGRKALGVCCSCVGQQELSGLAHDAARFHLHAAPARCQSRPLLSALALPSPTLVIPNCALLPHWAMASAGISTVLPCPAMAAAEVWCNLVGCTADGGYLQYRRCGVL